MPTRIATHVKRVVEERSILNHPFYRDLVNGHLPASHLRLYAAQYWYQVEAFSEYATTLVSRLPGNPKELLFRALAEELEEATSELWLDFAEGVGVPRFRVTREPLEETAAIIGFFENTTRNDPVAVALGAIYGHEAQMDAVAGKVADALVERYEVAENQVAYFRRRSEGRSQTERFLRALIDIASGPEGEDQAVRGVAAGSVATWRLLDAITRAATQATD